MANPIMNTLTAYVEQKRLPLIAQAVLKGKSASLFNLQTGVKTEAALNLLSTDVKFGDGLTCGWDEAGTQSLSQRILKTGNVKINMSYCDREMLKYWTQYGIRVAAGEEVLPFEEEFISNVIKGVQAGIEKMLWQGDTTSSDVNCSFDYYNASTNEKVRDGKTVDGPCAMPSGTTGVTEFTFFISNSEDRPSPRSGEYALVGFTLKSTSEPYEYVDYYFKVYPDGE